MTRPRKRPPTQKRHVEARAEPLRTPVAQAVSPEELARLEVLARTLEAAAVSCGTDERRKAWTARYRAKRAEARREAMLAS